MSENKIPIDEQVYRRKERDYQTKLSVYEDRVKTLDNDKKRDSRLYETEHAAPTKTTDDTMHSVQEFWLEAYPDAPIKPHRPPKPGTEVPVRVVTEDPLKGSVSAPSSAIVGEYITIEAHPKPNYRFVRWSDDATANPRDMYVSDEIDLIAYFELIPSPAFYITPSGRNSLSVTCNNLLNPEYSYDGYEWSLYTGAPAGVGPDEKLYWRASGRVTWDTSAFNIEGGNAALGGNVMSLLNKTDYESVVVVTDNAFEKCFYGMDNIVSIANLRIPISSVGVGGMAEMFSGTSISSIPRTDFMENTFVVNERSMYRMFADCKNLSSIPSTMLSSEILGKECYAYMFEGCERLNEVPKELLVATRLEEGCYSHMFSGCTRIVESYDLSNVELFAKQSCFGMFKDCTALFRILGNLPKASDYSFEAMYEGCTALVTIPTEYLPIDTENGCFYGMFRGCTSLLNVEGILRSELVEFDSYREMFKDCTAMVTPPSIPAVYSRDRSMQSMFEGCTSLESIPEIMIVSMDADVAKYMFRGCTSLRIISLPNTKSLSDGAFFGMFRECTSLIIANLAFVGVTDTSCQEMFYGCSKLHDIHCPFVMPSNYPKPSFKNWVWGVDNFGLPEGGYFYEAPNSHWMEFSADANPWGKMDDYKFPLTFYSDDAFQIKADLTGDSSDVIEYAYNLYSWRRYTPGTIISVPKGRRVYFRRNMLLPSYEDRYLQFKNVDGAVSVRGNLMSMVDSTNFETKTDCSMPYALYKMFQGFQFAESDKLVSSADKMADSCYKRLFALSTITDYEQIIHSGAELERGCYEEMLYRCRLLRESQEGLSLDSSIVPEKAYRGMFMASNIVETPILNFEDVMALGCESMFEKCEGLNKISVPNLQYGSKYIENDAFHNWALDVAEEGDFVCSETTFWPSGPSANPWRVVDNKYFWVENRGTTETTLRMTAEASLSFSRDLVIWEEFTGETTLVAGERVYIKGVSDVPGVLHPSVELVGEHHDNAVGGFINALYEGDAYEEVVTTADAADNLKEMFSTSGRQMTTGYLTDASELDLFFNMDWRATNGTFEGLFFNQTFLEKAPRMNSGYLVSGMCRAMFAQCSALVVPSDYLSELGSALVNECFYLMFYKTRSIEKSCDLHYFTSISGDSCAYSMFMESNIKKVGTYPNITSIFRVNATFARAFTNCRELVDASGDLWIGVSGVAGQGGVCEQMFYGCTSLTTAPRLLGLDLAGAFACADMFRDCTSLQYVPDIEGTTIGYGTFQEMFLNCKSLVYAPNMDGVTRVDASSCQSMFEGCIRLVKGPNAINVTDTSSGLRSFYRMFYGCTSLTDAPTINITRYGGVYQTYLEPTRYMFTNCKSLRELWIAGESPYMANYYDFKGIPSGGTLHTRSNVDWRRYHSIPDDWTIETDF